MKSWLGFAVVLLTVSSQARAQGAAKGAVAGDGGADAAADLPKGHPAPSETDAARIARAAMAEEAPQDSVQPAPSAPPGTIEVRVADPSDSPLAQTPVTLGILYNSVAKGENRKRVTQVTDEGGIARFTGLDTGSAVAYRPMVITNGATFSSAPFGLGPQGGMRANLHVYPVLGDVEQTLIVSQALVYAEVKDDRIQVQQVFRIYNLGKTAWVPNNFKVDLPPEYTAFATQQGMTDVGVDAIPNQGVSLRGTFAPGEHSVEFKWQLPYSGESEIKFGVGMPPHLAAAQVVVPASKGIGMSVDGFDSPKSMTDAAGQRLLTSQRRFQRDEAPLRQLSLAITGLPKDGPGRIIATLLAVGGVLVGIVFGSRKATRKATSHERERILEALEALEQARTNGTLGPNTYERERRELIDDLARMLAREDALAPKAVKRGKKARNEAVL